MDYILFNSDGSIATKQLKNFVQQGSEGVNTFFVSVDDLENPSEYECEAVFTLPDGSQNILSCEYQSSYTYDEDEEPRQGWTFGLTLAQTLYQGLLLVAIRLRLNANNIFVTYPFALVINETGVAPDTDTGIPLSALDSIIDYFKKYVDDNKGVKLYRHTIDIFNGGPNIYISKTSSKFTSLSQIYSDWMNGNSAIRFMIGINGHGYQVVDVVLTNVIAIHYVSGNIIEYMDYPSDTAVVDTVTEL